MANGQREREQYAPGQTPGGGWVPVPDPTTLTTEAVQRATEVFRREILALRETIETRLAGNDEQRTLLWTELHAWPSQLETILADRRREFAGDLDSAQQLIGQRLDGMDKAIELAASELAKFSELTRKECERRARAEREYVMAQIEIVQRVMTERFTAVDGRFAESKVAVDAAFAAAKEAVAEQNKGNDRAITKSETAVKEQLAALGTVTDAGLSGLEDKITDARDRINAIENLTRGIREATGETREVRNEQRLSQGAIVSLVGLLIVIVGVVVSVISISHP